MSQFDREGHFVYGESALGIWRSWHAYKEEFYDGRNLFKNADLIIKLQFSIFFQLNCLDEDYYIMYIYMYSVN